MSSSGDPGFEAWLAAVAKATDRDWVRRNLPALQRQYDETGGAPLKCPPPPERRTRDRYEEL